MRRLAAAASVLAAACLAAGTATSLAGSTPRSGPFAQFAACLNEHGAPSLAPRAGGAPKLRLPSRSHARLHQRRPFPAISAADREALRKAFAACRDQLPKPEHPKPPFGGPGHGFTLPTREQVAAFKACMAQKGPVRGAPGTMRPDLHDPAVRAALKSAFESCLPLLKPS